MFYANLVKNLLKIKNKILKYLFNYMKFNVRINQFGIKQLYS